MNLIRFVQAVAIVCFFATQGRADSALPLLSGFDQARIDAVYPPTDPDRVGELSKLVYRLRSVDRTILEKKAAAQPPQALGDATTVEGKVATIASLTVPERLVEFLDLQHLQVIDVEGDSGVTRVITTDLPLQAKAGDRIRGAGVLVEKAADATAVTVVAAPRVSWFPQSAPNAGWKMLSGQGVDVALLASVADRNKMPLMPEDGDAFYSLLAAAKQIGDGDPTVPPKKIKAVSLLENPKEYCGHWMQLPLETVQVTRVAVTEPRRQQQLGSDHYYQIDAFGDLGNMVVQIKRPEGDEGPPARFENRYPVSLVVRDLPPLLKNSIRQQEGGDAMVSEIRKQVVVDGFFFRLWSYSTDFMKQHGGGDQFGPLLVAARIDGRPSEGEDPAGVGIIGWIAAAAVLLGIVAIWIWHQTITRRDELVKEKRKQSESEQLQLPDEAAY